MFGSRACTRRGAWRTLGSTDDVPPGDLEMPGDVSYDCSAYDCSRLWVPAGAGVTTRRSAGLGCWGWAAGHGPGHQALPPSSVARVCT